MNRLLTAILLMLVLGCEPEPQPEPAPAVPPPTTAPDAPEAAAPQHPPPMPTVAYMTIDGQLQEFPRARLVLQRRDDALHALLFSDDPPRAMRDQYDGNSFYIEMRLDARDVTGLPQVVWSQQALTSERAEAPDGIFIEGWRKHLQPFDVEVHFEQLEHDRIAVWLAGRFMQFHTRERLLPGELTAVSARLVVKPELR